MIDEQQHDLAIGYVFGHLEGDARREFEAWVESDAALRDLVDELSETTAALALSAPQHLPRPEVRDRVLSIARGEAAAVPPAAARKTGWIPWAIAAGLAITCTFLYAERTRWRQAVRSAEAEIARAFAKSESSRKEATKLAEQVLIYDLQKKAHSDQVAALRDEIVKLRGRDALAQLQIAALSAQVAEFAKAGVIIVWDPQEQRGVARLANLPKPAEGKDYQLWLIDPKIPAPVSGGVITMADAGTTRVSFKPGQFIEHAEKFAISVEQAGGVEKVAGPIIFVGQ